jgi:hypothetical protein
VLFTLNSLQYVWFLLNFNGKNPQMERELQRDIASGNLPKYNATRTTLVFYN